MRDGKARVPTGEELTHMHAIVAAKRYAKRNAAIIALSYGCGMRAGEIASLVAGDVLTTAGQFKTEFVIKWHKSKSKRARQVFITNARVRDALTAYINELLTQGEIALAGPLFKSQWGTHFNGHGMSNMIGNLYREAGLDGCKSHSGRRSFATVLLRNRTDIRSVQVLLGHATIQQTAEYADTDAETMRAAVESAI